ncbi:MarR family winged helix-turn-helix transcriptional regulator [Amedibacillus sp. YH-ame6]
MDEMEIVRRLYHMFYMMRRESVRFSAFEEHHGIRNRDLMILDYIVQGGNLMKMSDISTYFNVTPAAVSQMMRSLEKNQWIERVIPENDRRSVYIKVSDTGMEVIGKNEEHVTEKLVEFIEILGEEDSQALIRILEKCREHFKQMKKEHCKKGDHTC